MKKIWKWTLQPGKTTIEMPKDAEILTVQTQFHEPQLWALVDPGNNIEIREFITVGTGHSIEKELGKYIGTFQLHNGSLVFHAFEI
jgi:hypothetical protein